MSTTVVVFAWIGLAVGLVVALLVVWLFDCVVRPALEIERYARAILDAGLGITRNLDGVDEAVRTRDLATAVPGLAVAYLQKLGEGMTPLLALSNGVETAWTIGLAVGLVVAVVVWYLLEWLRRTVVAVEEGVTAIWTAGKLVAQNTQTTHLLQTTKARGGDLLAELGEHARLAERSER